METEHIQKCVSMMRRANYVTTDEYIDACASGACLQGEYAQMAADNEIDQMRVHPVLQVFLNELLRRKKDEHNR